MSEGIITAADLKQRLVADDAPIVIDVLPESSYETAHLPGAKNVCVYEMTFVDEVQKLVPDKDMLIVVYGSSAQSLASQDAARKLVRAGYTQVWDFRDGLLDWKNSGFPVEGQGGDEPEPKPLVDGRYVIDTEASGLFWIGRNVASTHEGELTIAEGEGTVENGTLTGACFVLDMTQITCTDLEDSKLNRLLIQHLQGDDFFDTEKYPKATFTTRRIDAIEGATPGTPNTSFQGDLTLKGVTNSVAFDGTLHPKDGQLVAQANFDIDRTRWNVFYGSGRFYEKLGMHLVNDLVTLLLKITLKKA